MSSEPPVLLTTPEPDPDEEQALPLAAPGGRLWVNDRNCFQVGSELLLVPHGSTVSVDPPGIHVPGSVFVPLGSDVWGAGGHFSIDDTDEPARYRELATPETEGVVFLWQLDVVSSTGSDGPGVIVLDEGPFFHGTKADLHVGDLLTAGFRSNYRPSVVMNHVYFTALLDGAGLAAELAAGDAEPRVYVVKPHGDWEDDPNVTDKKFPGNPSRSYRTSEPLMVVDEVDDWPRLSPEALAGWRARLEKIEAEKGEIIN